MSIGKYDTPPPQAPQLHSDLIRWAMDLIAWLRSEESDPVDTLEDDFVFGGEGVASRMFGFEGVDVAPGATDVIELMAAPAAGKKKIITDLVISMDGTSMELRIYKKKGATEYNYDPSHDLTSSKESWSSIEHSSRIVLDSTDEPLEVEIVATVGGGDFFWNGNYLDVD